MAQPAPPPQPMAVVGEPVPLYQPALASGQPASAYAQPPQQQWVQPQPAAAASLPAYESPYPIAYAENIEVPSTANLPTTTIFDVDEPYGSEKERLIVAKEKRCVKVNQMRLVNSCCCCYQGCAHCALPLPRVLCTMLICLLPGPSLWLYPLPCRRAIISCAAWSVSGVGHKEARLEGPTESRMAHLFVLFCCPSPPHFLSRG